MESELWDNMMIEIISRSSLKTIDKMRCTSKGIERLMYDNYLLNLFNERTDTVSGFIVEKFEDGTFINKFAPSSGSKEIDLDFLPQHARIVGSSEQGIIAFESPDADIMGLTMFCVCKPTTKQWIQLPNPNTSYVTEKVVVFVTGSNLHYQIMRLSLPTPSVLRIRDVLYTAYHCEIFNSRTWEWRVLDALILPYWVFPNTKEPITRRGSTYMLLSNSKILKFDVYTETWSMLSSPRQTMDYDVNSKKHLIKHEGKLGFACQPPNGFWEIWILGDDDSWVKTYVSNNKEVERKAWNNPNYKLAIHKGNTIDKIALVDCFDNVFVYRSDFDMANLAGID